MQSLKILGALTIAAMLLGLTACVEALDASPKPNLTPTPQVVTTRLTALITGRLSLQDNCLRVNSHLLVWSPEFKVSIENETVKVQDVLLGGEAVWQIGQEVRLGGGEVQYQSLTETVQRRIPAHCQGPYWLVGSITAPQTPSSATP